MAPEYQINRVLRWAVLYIPGTTPDSLRKCADSNPPDKSGKPSDCFAFAIWRDPLDRFLSLIHESNESRDAQVEASPSRSPEGWIAFAEAELSKPVEQQDHRFRRQVESYRPEDVDAIIDLNDLNDWFFGRGWGRLGKVSIKAPSIKLTDAQRDRIRILYSTDEALRPSPLPVEQPVVTGLWVGDSLTPLAVLCMKSFLDHGFRFRLAAYREFEGTPDGVERYDASSILAGDEVFRHSNGSYAPFSDWFRYRLLAEQGGLWVDMDVACLHPFRIRGCEPWFAFESPSTIALGMLSFHPGHPVPTLLAELSEDPARPMPWDNPDDRERKLNLLKRHPNVRGRRVNVRWGHSGPEEITRALRHFKQDHLAAPIRSLFAIHWSSWRNCHNGRRTLDEPVFQLALGIHLWGEMLRREPDVLLDPPAHGIVPVLMKRHDCASRITPNQISASDKGRILVAVCSCRGNAAQRQAIRETWLNDSTDRIETVFFVGEGEIPIEDEPDTILLGVSDHYDALPHKVREFFRVVLERHDFDWLFKCDDDTYVALARLDSLPSPDHDLIGNEFLDQRGSPSGGAGYLLSREIVRKLSQDNNIPRSGAEDILIGEAARQHGARPLATRRLCWNRSRYPRRENDVITSHWCQPERMRAIHAILHEEPMEIRQVIHQHWKDDLAFHVNGCFFRLSTGCIGIWWDEGDLRRLKWFDWGEEVLLPSSALDASSPSLYRCRASPVSVIVIELRGGLGNQMFQYAHALALGQRFGVPVRVAYSDFGRPFALHHFGIKLDPGCNEPFELIEFIDNYPENGEWPTAEAILRSSSDTIKIAGYFQNENFFLPAADRVRQVFRLPSIPPPVPDRVTPVCVHVRRGDFLKSRAHPVCGAPYYSDAMRLMTALVGNPHFVVISDDPEWCDSTFSGFPYVTVMGMQTEIEAFSMMLGCKAFILSSSTFGWWGAWLAGTGPVIAPNRFLNNRNWRICPDSWITLPLDGIKHLQQEATHMVS